MVVVVSLFFPCVAGLLMPDANRMDRRSAVLAAGSFSLLNGAAALAAEP